MKRSFAVVLIMALALVAQTASAEPVLFNFASEAGATIKFNGSDNTIKFPKTTYDFAITSASPWGIGQAVVGLSGDIDGTFAVGSISPITGGETALVSSTNGKFIVYGGGDALTADLDWKNISVYNCLFGVMNASGVVNLSNVSYAGSNSALLAIRDGQQQTVVLTFQFPPLAKKSLTELMVDGQVNSTSFSGSLSSVPEPSTLVLLAGAAIGLVAFARRRKA